jgi:hypothetical protein
MDEKPALRQVAGKPTIRPGDVSGNLERLGTQIGRVLLGPPDRERVRPVCPTQAPPKLPPKLHPSCPTQAMPWLRKWTLSKPNTRAVAGKPKGSFEEFARLSTEEEAIQADERDTVTRIRRGNDLIRRGFR